MVDVVEPTMDDAAAANALAVAADSATPAPILRRVYENAVQNRADKQPSAQAEFEAVAEAVARNPNAPPELLAAVVGLFPRAFCENPLAPFLPLEAPDFIHTLTDDALLALLCHDAPPSLVAPLAVAPAHYHRTARWEVWKQSLHHVAVAGHLECERWERELRAYCQTYCTREEASTEEKHYFSDFIELGLLPNWEGAVIPPPDKTDKTLTPRIAGDYWASDEKSRALAKILNPLADKDATRATARLCDPTISLALVLHDETPADVLEMVTRAGYSDAARRRFFAAFHANASAGLIAHLAYDASPVVRRLARRHKRAFPRLTALGRRAAIEKPGNTPIWFLLSGLHGKRTPADLSRRTNALVWMERLSAVFAVGKGEDTIARTDALTYFLKDGNRFVRTAARVYLDDTTYRFTW